MKIIDLEYIHPLELSSEAKLKTRHNSVLESFLSKKSLEAQILNLAEIFRNCSELYFPVRLDYRGRVYCIVDYLNYQGTELAKALLQFSKGVKVNINDQISINYLKINGANCFGLDKKSFKDRLAWVNENIQNILDFENGELISKAENKLLFLITSNKSI